VRVILSRQAKLDVSKAVDWYEAQREGLGTEFIESVDECVGRIGANPLAYRVVSGDNRRANLERFPYALFYKVRDEVVVVACLHAKRSPSLAKERAAGVLEFRKPKP
jgi:toxin ParE1/3/4